MVDKDFSMSVISFKRLDWADMVVHIVDMSPTGIGVEVEKRMDPGFVWFMDRVDGQKGGLLMWSKQLGNKYRGGIKFVPIPPEEAQTVQMKIELSGPEKDPTDVVDTILEALKKSGGNPTGPGGMVM